MRSILVSVAVVAVLAVGGYYGFDAIQTQRGRAALADTGLDFMSFDAALRASRQRERPVLVDFSAIWCPTCRRLHREVFTDPGVKAALSAGYVLARVDYDAPEASAFMQKYDVHGFPTLLVLDAEGRLVRRLPVTFEPAAFVAALNTP